VRNLRLLEDPCVIAGCGRYGTFYATRPINREQTVVKVCKKCAAELNAVYGWKIRGRISN
jgi:hypothetical protein